MIESGDRRGGIWSQVLDTMPPDPSLQAWRKTIAVWPSASQTRAPLGERDHFADAQAAQRASVRVPRPARRPDPGAAARRARHVPVCESWSEAASSPADGVVTISPAQLGYLLEGIDWRMPKDTWRPQAEADRTF